MYQSNPQSATQLGQSYVQSAPIGTPVYSQQTYRPNYTTATATATSSPLQKYHSQQQNFLYSGGTYGVPQVNSSVTSVARSPIQSMTNHHHHPHSGPHVAPSSYVGQNRGPIVQSSISNSRVIGPTNSRPFTTGNLPIVDPSSRNPLFTPNMSNQPKYKEPDAVGLTEILPHDGKVTVVDKYDYPGHDDIPGKKNKRHCGSRKNKGIDGLEQHPTNNTVKKRKGCCRHNKKAEPIMYNSEHENEFGGRKRVAA